MLHHYEIDLAPLHDDRVVAIFSRIIYEISDSGGLIMHCKLSNRL